MNKLLERTKSDTFLGLPNEQGIINDTLLNLVICINNRKVNGITQSDMSELCGVSLSSIKRFEMLKLDKLSLYLKYMKYLYNLKSK